MATRKHTLESGEIDAAEDARVAKRRVKRLAKKKLRKVYPVKLCEGFEVFVTYKGGYALACVLAVEKQDAGFDQITVQVLHNGQEVTRTVGEKAAEVWRSAPAHLADKGRASRKELRLEKTVPFSHVPLQGAAALDTGMRAADAEEMLLRSEKVTGVIRATLTPAPKQRAPVRVCSALEDPKKRLTFLDTHCGSNKLATEIMLYSRNGWRVLSNDLDPTTNADTHLRFCDIDLPHLAEKYTLAHVHMAPACDTVCASANGNYGRHEGAEGLHNGKADLAADSPGLEVKLAIANADFGAMESNICELLYEHTNRTFSIEMPKQSHFHKMFYFKSIVYKLRALPIPYSHANKLYGLDFDKPGIVTTNVVTLLPENRANPYDLDVLLEKAKPTISCGRGKSLASTAAYAEPVARHWARAIVDHHHLRCHEPEEFARLRARHDHIHATNHTVRDLASGFEMPKQ